MTTKDYQMFWDCSYCGTKELLGVSHRHCPNCGGAQDENKRYFPPEGREVELHDHVYFGVDWDCQHCSTPNSKNSNNCVNCGSPQNGAVEVDLVGQAKVEKVKKPKIVKEDFYSVENKETPKAYSNFDSSTKGNYSHETSNSKYTTEKSVSSVSKNNSGNKALIALITIVFACVIGFLIYGFTKVSEHTVVVMEKTWSRSVDVEEYRSVSDTDWCSNMPSDAYAVSSFRDVRSHRQVADGQTCSTSRHDRGDGSYRTERVCHTKYRSEPVYDNRCRYSVNRWRFNNSELASGSGTSVPKDPEVNHLMLDSNNRLGNKRLGSRSSSYKVIFNYQDDDKVVKDSCGYNQLTWSKFDLKRQYNGKVRMIGGLICNEITDSNIHAPYVGNSNW